MKPEVKVIPSAPPGAICVTDKLSLALFHPRAITDQPGNKVEKV
jgi:hypothetical protein